ncbi:hypothetical protein [Comamonas faecalis]|uniref:hypothetical protein n=1 Tax=Comamonas faecalis TaxID=1387849 RepID=UPI0031EC6D6C
MTTVPHHCGAARHPEAGALDPGLRRDDGRHFHEVTNVCFYGDAIAMSVSLKESI